MKYRVLMIVEVAEGEKVTLGEMIRLVKQKVGERVEIKGVQIVDCDPVKEKKK